MNKNILIIDDEIIVCRTLKRLFDLRGHKTWHAQRLADAKVLIAEMEFDTIFIDWQLNDAQNGLDFATDLKADMPNADIILMTGHDAVKLAETLPAQSHFKIIQKPCTLDQLCEIAGLSGNRSMPSAISD